MLDTGQGPGERISAEKFSELRPHISEISKAAQALLPGCRPVRAISFNKTEQSNWTVGWHQDRTIAVQAKRVVNGYTHWTKKSGVWCCEPPIEILQNMIFARIHLDDSTDQNGCLEVAIKSHLAGKLQKRSLETLIQNSETEVCAAKAGDVLFGAALLVHKSMPSKTVHPRRALRIDFANVELAGDLEWLY